MSNKAATYEQAKYQYISRTADAGMKYQQPSKDLSAEFNKWWVLRDNYGFIAAIDKKTGKIL
ncbi:MAG: hypothetical protein L7S72_09525 [Flavobacteriales bacterium]|nr:hypothetical protein [Flavobacteriales bacterium]